jgi:hypothetical protein
VQAHLGEKKFARALGEVERSSWFLAPWNKEKQHHISELLLSKVPHQPARRLARFQIKTKALARPYASPLLFTKDGQLWALTEDKTKRLTMEGDPPLTIPATEDEPEKTIEAPVWSMNAQNAEGTFAQAALPSCDRSEVLLALSTESSPNVPPTLLPLPVLAPRPGKCGALAFAPAPLEVVPLRWEAGALSFILGGELLSSRTGAKTENILAAWGTSLGVAVHRKEGLSLLTGASALGLHHCVTNSDGTKVACVGEGSVSVLTAEAENKGDGGK